MPVDPALVQWVIQTGLTIPLLLYVAYHIKYGKIGEIYENMGSIIKVLIAVARTNDDIKEEEVTEEFSPDERAVADYIDNSGDRKSNGSRTTIKQQD